METPTITNSQKDTKQNDQHWECYITWSQTIEPWQQQYNTIWRRHRDQHRLTQNEGPPKKLSIIYKELKHVHTVKINYSINKWTSELNEINNYKWQKKHPTSLAIEETQIKIALKFHFSPVSLAIAKMKNENNIVGMESDTAIVEIMVDLPKIQLPYGSSIPYLVYSCRLVVSHLGDTIHLCLLLHETQ